MLDSIHLDVETRDGKAWVDLRLQQGHPPGPGYQYHQSNALLAITNSRNSTTAPRQKSSGKALNDSRDAEEARATADETSSNAMGKAIGVDQRWESSE